MSPPLPAVLPRPIEVCRAPGPMMLCLVAPPPLCAPIVDILAPPRPPPLGDPSSRPRISEYPSIDDRGESDPPPPCPWPPFPLPSWPGPPCPSSPSPSPLLSSFQNAKLGCAKCCGTIKGKETSSVRRRTPIQRGRSLNRVAFSYAGDATGRNRRRNHTSRGGGGQQPCCNAMSTTIFRTPRLEVLEPVVVHIVQREYPPGHLRQVLWDREGKMRGKARR